VKRWVAAAAVVAIAAAGFAAFAWWRTARGTRTEGPIVLVSIDTLRADRLPLYGYGRGSAPRLDAFARDAIVFDRAFAHAPQTLPSHASLLTGLLPFEHGARDNIGFTLPATARTLQQGLRDRGYTTAGIVSSYVLRTETGIAAGFDHFDDDLPPVSADRSLSQVQRDGSETLKAAARWLDTRSGDRFFLFFHIYEPHKPWAPPDRYRHLDPYDGDVAYADEIVGGLFDALRARGLYDAATIVVLSDHGEGLGDHVEQEHGLFLYDESVRVPFLVKLPASRGGGRRVSDPVQLIDVRPTLLALSGAESGRARGRSLVPLLTQSGSIEPQGVYAEALYPRYHFGWSELLSLTDERYRYIKAPREELYDLERDPHERANIAGDRPQVAAAMRQALVRISAGARVDQPAAASPEDRERLAALGYVGTGPAIDASTPGEQLPDPKDKIHVLERYRQAVEFAGLMQLREARAVFRELLREEPNMIDVWTQYAQVLVRTGDLEGALRAFQEVLRRNPTEIGTLITAASALLQLGRLDEARQHAELAVSRSPATAHEMLARIAAIAGDADAARRHAKLGHEADPTLPLPEYVEGLLHYRAGRYGAAAPYFLQAAQLLEGRTLQLADLHYYAGDALARVERYDEAERQFSREIQLTPHHARARAGLAMLYRAMGRDEASDRAIDEMLRVSPTAEAYALAADLWTMFGRPDRAAATRAQARERFAAPGAPPGTVR
jgi:arylsulfatase A-like enzyme/tetratricopeptide (TPR) repeat protein